MALGLWVLCACIDLPNYVGLGAHIFDDKKMGCSFDRIDHYGYSIYFVIMGVVMPLFLVLFSYTKVFMFVKESDRRVSIVYVTLVYQRSDHGTLYDFRTAACFTDFGSE